MIFVVDGPEKDGSSAGYLVLVGLSWSFLLASAGEVAALDRVTKEFQEVSCDCRVWMLWPDL